MCTVQKGDIEEQIEVILRGGQFRQLMELYFGRRPEPAERLVVYSYIALGGFLWSLWAVYKASLGEEFGEYTLIMYRYAKRYYQKILELP